MAVAGKPGEKRRRRIASTECVPLLIAMLQATPLKASVSTKRMADLVATVIGLQQLSPRAGAGTAAERSTSSDLAPAVVGVQEQAVSGALPRADDASSPLTRPTMSPCESWRASVCAVI